ncbi:LacI family transcriptional regulator [Lachnospiraceae bacterium ASD4241]|uniref:LacI family transcriptional regulator n=1 Tax=Diplocloster modestus TaxID=2850322 RepID=A0ABS6K7W4_9FIRM|nr:LacI family transcriptional regulator [Diplocloster modestus]
MAKQAGVSPATVSRYISGNSIVSDEKAEKIEGAMKMLDYTPGSGKRQKDKGVIAVLLPNLQQGYFTEVLKELIEQIPRYQYRVMIIPTFPGDESYKLFFKEVSITGVIYLDEEVDQAVLNYIGAKNIKSVMLGGATSDSRCEMIRINDLSAGYDVTRYLLERGHEQILFLAHRSQSIGSGYQRLMGCRRALEEYGMVFDDSWVEYGSPTYENGYRLTSMRIERGMDFTAVFAFSDEMALGAIAALADHADRVPEEISVIGFDGISISQRVIPRLTTVRQPIGQFVTKILDAFQNPEERFPNMEIVLPYSILEGGTCISRKKGQGKDGTRNLL